jgi:hypothetical protein
MKNKVMIASFMMTAILVSGTLMMNGQINSVAVNDSWPAKTSSFSLYGSTLPELANVFNGSFEFLKHREKIHHGFTTGLTMTFYWGFEEPDLGIHLAYTILTGKRNNHFESKLGGVVNLFPFHSGSVNTILLPVVSLGYRYQAPEGRKFFRVALSTAGLGIGFGTLLSPPQNQ